jgi:hypothetical protein
VGLCCAAFAVGDFDLRNGMRFFFHHQKSGVEFLLAQLCVLVFEIFHPESSFIQWLVGNGEFDVVVA